MFFFYLQEFWKLTRLRHLNISDNRISQLPPQIGNFTLLTHLDISRNDIRSLPEELGHLANLAFLDISGNPLSNRMLPDAIWKLHNLRKLSANDVCLCELPEDICKLVLLLNSGTVRLCSFFVSFFSGKNFKSSISLICFVAKRLLSATKFDPAVYFRHCKIEDQFLEGYLLLIL